MDIRFGLKAFYSATLAAAVAVSLTTPAVAEKPGVRSPTADISTRADPPVRVDLGNSSSNAASGYGATTNNITSGQTTTSTSVNIARPNLQPASSVNQNLLNKQLASQDQMGQAGVPITGGSNASYRGANTTADQYGGDPVNWQKRSSRSHTAPDGTQFETHWLENPETGQRVQFKTKISQ